MKPLLQQLKPLQSEPQPTVALRSSHSTINIYAPKAVFSTTISTAVALFLLFIPSPQNVIIRGNQAKRNAFIATLNVAALLKAAKTFVMQCLDIAKLSYVHRYRIVAIFHQTLNPSEINLTLCVILIEQ